MNKIAMYEDNQARETLLINIVLIKSGFYSRGEKSGKRPDTTPSRNACSLFFATISRPLLLISFPRSCPNCKIKIPA